MDINKLAEEINTLTYDQIAELFEKTDYKKLTKALIYYEKKSSFEELNEKARDMIINKAYDKYINNDSFTSLLNKRVGDMVERIKDDFIEKNHIQDLIDVVDQATNKINSDQNTQNSFAVKRIKK
ncbi:hypothetical protein CDJ58_03720 [Campylobacter lari]|uniref:Uncharacterized protein n=1 Tax=Campylobacter peloridis TaxID=488546 RepID=A0A5C7DTN4_9BACT|nr:hypothetical protein [Campylobacter peloridis]EAH8851037.1 hypothetical protein [Campylobacter lari]EAK5748507.1 hypothetical protein [Campylobacter lari]EAK9878164.1 hypothetical protein [Campylobacter lari]TXE84766.1 hypothetical protein FPD46_00590 [Campylobacter peloridis]